MAGNSCGLDGGNEVLEVIPVIVLWPTAQRRFSQASSATVLAGLLSVPGAAGTGADTKCLPPGLRAVPMGGSAGSTSPATISRTRRDVELAAETSQPRTFCSLSSTGTGTGWKRAQGPLTAGLQLRACCLSLESGMCQAPGLSHLPSPSSGKGPGAVIGVCFFLSVCFSGCSPIGW